MEHRLIGTKFILLYLLKARLISFFSPRKNQFLYNDMDVILVGVDSFTIFISSC